MSTNSVKVAVIILTINQQRKATRCLESFRAVTHPSFRIILWDNGSGDGTPEIIRQEFPEVLLHRHPSNLGVASGRNEAAKIAIREFNPPYILFIDNDMTVSPDFLAKLIAPFETQQDLAQTAGKIYDLNDHRRLYGAGGCRIRFWCGDTGHVGYGEIDYGQYDKPRKCYPSGGCMLVRTDVFQQLGGFDAVFNPYGPEDLDFALRVRKAGYYGFFAPDAVVFHETRPGKTFEGGKYTETFARHRSKHWLLFMKRHAPLWQKAIFMSIIGPYLFGKVLLREFKKGNFTVFRGLLTGLAESGKVKNKGKMTL